MTTIKIDGDAVTAFSQTAEGRERWWMRIKREGSDWRAVVRLDKITAWALGERVNQTWSYAQFQVFSRLERLGNLPNEDYLELARISSFVLSLLADKT